MADTCEIGSRFQNARNSSTNVRNVKTKPYFAHKDTIKLYDPESGAKINVPTTKRKPLERPPPNIQLPNRRKKRSSSELSSTSPSHSSYDRGLSDTSTDGDDDDDPEPNVQMLLQPATRPISHDQLVAEVKHIYPGLVIVEAKCTAIDEKITFKQEPFKNEPLKNDQWQSLIALHKELLHELHDFNLASQHPAADKNLSNLAEKYSMPVRMWRPGIHAFLEILTHRMPDSPEHIPAFIYIAYSMMALLYKNVPTFEKTWIEYLGDLGRYRMAIEDDELEDREIWSGVALYWYSKAADRQLTLGRLYHLLASLARPYTLEQISFYNRSLTCITPFKSARESIMTFFNPILSKATSPGLALPDLLVSRICRPSFLGPKGHSAGFDQSLTDFKAQQQYFVEEVIEKNGSGFKCTGIFLAVSNFAALFSFGFSDLSTRDNRLLEPESALDPRIADEHRPTLLKDLSSKESSKAAFHHAHHLLSSMSNALTSNVYWSQKGVWYMVHVIFVYFWTITQKLDIANLWKHTERQDVACCDNGELKKVKPQRGIFQDETHSLNSGTAFRAVSEDCIWPYDEASKPHTFPLFPEKWFGIHTRKEEEVLVQVSRWPYLSWAIRWDERRRKQVKFLPKTLKTLRSMISVIQPQSSIGSLVVLLLFSRVVAAMPLPTTESKSSDESVSTSAVNSVADISALILVVFVLGAAHLLVMIKGNAVTVYGTLMAAYSFGWWCIRNDTATSSGLSWAVFFVWCVASIQYCRSAFKNTRPPSYIPLVAVGLAIALDLVIVGYMTPSDSKLSQADLLDLSLPSTSLALYITAVALAAYDRRLPWADGVFAVEHLA